MRWLRKCIFGTRRDVSSFFITNFFEFLFLASVLAGASENPKKNCDVIYFHFSPNESFVREKRGNENKSININNFFVLHSSQ